MNESWMGEGLGGGGGVGGDPWYTWQVWSTISLSVMSFSVVQNLTKL